MGGGGTFEQSKPFIFIPAHRIKKYAWAKVQLVAMMRLAVYTLMGLDRIDEASLGEFWLNDVVDYIRKKIIGQGYKSFILAPSARPGGGRGGGGGTLLLSIIDFRHWPF